MAYFEPYVDADGIHVPTYYDIMDYFVEQYKAIFGSDVYVGEETPDYQMMSVVAKCVSDYSELVVESYNNRDPMYASGNSLDILAQFAGLVRERATASTAVLKITGDSGTVIPADSKAIDKAGNLWTLDEEVTIPVAGYTTVGSTCDTLGAVQAVAGDINGIYTPTPGWTAVTNESSATVGLDTESDAKLRVRFMNSHAVSSKGLVESIVSAITSVSGVEYVTLVHNDTNTDYSGSGGLPPHSICAIVDGGDDEDIATMIMRMKPPGVATYGNQSPVTVVDEYGNSNSIYFSRPTTVQVHIAVTVQNLGGYDATRTNQIIINSLMADINGLGIGRSWAVTMGYKDIYSQFDSSDTPIAVTSITSSDATGGVVDCGYDEILSLTASNVTITVNT